MSNTRLINDNAQRKPRRVAKFLKQMKITQEAFIESLGCRKNHGLLCLLDMNPEMTMRDLSAYIVENQERMR